MTCQGISWESQISRLWDLPVTLLSGSSRVVFERGTESNYTFRTRENLTRDWVSVFISLFLKMPCTWVGLDSVANWIMWIKIIEQCFPWRGWRLANALSPQCWVTRKERRTLRAVSGGSGRGRKKPIGQSRSWGCCLRKEPHSLRDSQPFCERPRETASLVSGTIFLP